MNPRAADQVLKNYIMLQFPGKKIVKEKCKDNLTTWLVKSLRKEKRYVLRNEKRENKKKVNWKSKDNENLPQDEHSVL